MTPIRSLLHAVDPYDGFDASAYPLDLDGWNGQHSLFVDLVKAVRPALAIEVGSWKGQSAATIGKELKANGGELLCVDTWLGSTEFRTNTADARRYRSLRLQHGYPAVYYQFLANMIHCGLQDVVTPFPQTSVNAARVLAFHKVKAQLVYIDASHDAGDVLADLRAWWPLLADGGIMFGDDYHKNWPAVIHETAAFASEVGRCLESVLPCFWIIRK